jgi:hypothetical protein
MLISSFTYIPNLKTQDRRQLSRKVHIFTEQNPVLAFLHKMNRRKNTSLLIQYLVRFCVVKSNAIFNGYEPRA